MIKNLLFVLVLILSTNIFASTYTFEYRNAQMKSESGKHIYVSYRLNKIEEGRSGKRYWADKISVSVNSWRYGQLDARGVLVFNRQCDHREYEPSVIVKEFPFYTSTQRSGMTSLYANLAHDIFPVVNQDYGYGAKCVYDQEIAIVINGEWLVDPGNGTHNFKFNMNY